MEFVCDTPCLCGRKEPPAAIRVKEDAEFEWTLLSWGESMCPEVTGGCSALGPGWSNATSAAVGPASEIVVGAGIKLSVALADYFNKGLATCSSNRSIHLCQPFLVK